MMEMGKSLFYNRAKKSLKCAVQANLLIIFSRAATSMDVLHIVWRISKRQTKTEEKTPVSIACVRWEKRGENVWVEVNQKSKWNIENLCITYAQESWIRMHAICINTNRF